MSWLFFVYADLKKTMAVLLENLIDRISVLEKQLAVMNNSNLPSHDADLHFPAAVSNEHSKDVAAEKPINAKGNKFCISVSDTL